MVALSAWHSDASNPFIGNGSPGKLKEADHFTIVPKQLQLAKEFSFKCCAG